jgi:catechol 2,3-dioxygenase-like lactoylglutathione lyase family enzyme
MNTMAKRTLASEYPHRVKPSKFAHVVLLTPDLGRSRDWYLTVLDGHVGYENDMVCFLTYDEEHHRVGLVSVPGLVPRAPNSYGLDHLAFTYPTLGALLANYQYLRRRSIEPYWAINHGPTISMYYRDPDGNKVEMQYDVFANTADLEAFFAAGNYRENFMGIIFDPEELIARYEAGVSLEELVQRPKLPPGKTPCDMHRP